jgi:monodictyphenone polyketide synthase
METARLVYFGNEFPPGDLTVLFRQLDNYSKDKRHPLLAMFLDEAANAVQDEVNTLPLELRNLVPSFDTIFTLAAAHELRRGALCGSIDGVLLGVLQIGAFIG